MILYSYSGWPTRPLGQAYGKILMGTFRHPYKPLVCACLLPPIVRYLHTQTNYSNPLSLWTIPRFFSTSRSRWCGCQEQFRCPAGSRVSAGASVVGPPATAIYPRSHRLVCIQIGPETDDNRKLGHNISVEHPLASNPWHGSRGVQT